MNKRIFYALIFVFMTINVGLMGQYRNFEKSNEEFSNNTYESFINYYKAGINEKLYLQTDKPYYSAGEEIWFKGYLINSITHAPIDISNFIYVELTDQRDSLFARIKIKADEYGFHNSITLPNSITEGDYTLTAYTQWMRNWDKSLFFNRKISIANPIDDAVTINATYTKEDNGETSVNLSFHSASFSNIEDTRMEYAYYVDGKLKSSSMKIGQDKTMKITLPKNISSPDIKFTSLNQNIPLSKTIYVPAMEDKIDVQFFPEGGALLANQFQNIVFKAIGADGLSREVTGNIFNSKDEKIADIKTDFKGMGQITLMASADDQYYALVSEVGFEQETPLRFELPKATDSGCTIKAVMNKHQVIYQVLATPDINLSKLALVVHSRGQVINSTLINSTQQARRLALDDLPEGILTIAIINLEDKTPIAERLIFVPTKQTNTQVTANKTAYQKRTLVNLDLNINDEFGAIEGDFSVAVTDRNSVDTKQLKDNIVSYTLLSSDLSGHIEDAADYFTDNKTQDMANRDLLILTQGWKRFEIGDILKNEFKMPYLVPEESHTISGNIKGFFGNKVKNTNLIILNPANRYFDMQPLEGSNEFTLSGIDYPDSTSLRIQAASKKGTARSSMELNINPETFPEAHYPFPLPLIGKEKPTIPEAYLSQSKEKYYYEGGMRVIDMDAITLTAERPTSESNRFNVTPSHSIRKSDLENNSHLTVMEALRLFPGVMVMSDGGIMVQGTIGVPLVYLDDVETEFDYVSYINLSLIESMDFVTGAEAAIFGSGSGMGVLLLRMKIGASLADALPSSPSLVNINQLGYKKPSELYQPKYDVQEVFADKNPDLRTTICWDPQIKTDENGKASISFYTADRPSTYDVVLEGISKNGKVIRYETSIERR